MMNISYYLQPKVYNNGNFVYRKGDPCDGFYLIEEGSFEIIERIALP